MVTLRQATILGGIFAAAVAAPVACFYPSYTFNDDAAGGAGGTGPTSTTTSNTSGGGATSTTTSTTGSMSSSSSMGASGPGGGGNGGVGAQGGGGMAVSSSSMGGASSSTAMSSSSTGGGTEDCENGVDDNGDNLIDCQDPQCSAYQCVAAVPAGWTGYFAVYDGAPAGDPDCFGDYPSGPLIASTMFFGPPATCTACSCGAVTGETCFAPPSVNSFDGTCSGAAFCGAVLPFGVVNGVCAAPGGALFSANTCGMNSGPACDMGSAPCALSVESIAPSVGGGSCTASGGVITKPPAGFSGAGRACAAAPITAGGCNGAQKCLPKPDPASYPEGICVQKVGANMCPAGAFQDQHIFYTGSTDTRACTGCSCSSASGGTCSGTVQVYSDVGCNTQIASYTPPGCANLVGNPTIYGRKFTVTSPPSGSSCQQSGGQATGAATPTGPTTYCCL